MELLVMEPGQRVVFPEPLARSDAWFLRFCAQNPHLWVERDSAYNLTLMAPVNPDSGWRESKVAAYLQLWADTQGGGRVFSSSTRFFLPNGAVLIPDAAWVPEAPYQAWLQGPKPAPLVPHLVVEIQSSTDRPALLQPKMLDWLQGGVRLAWLLDPATETAHIYRAGNPQPETLSGFHHTLLGERVLPGFRFELQRLRG